MTSSTYYKDYYAGYIRIYDIPYKYWDRDIIALAKQKEPTAYYEQLLALSLKKEIMATPEEVLISIPEKYRTLKIYKRLLEQDCQRFYKYVPYEYLNKIKPEVRNDKYLLGEFKNIPEVERTPDMYKALSRISFDDYLMYVVNYHDIPDKERNKKMCLSLFYSNIEKYIKEIPNAYKSQELCNMLAQRNLQKYFKYIPEALRTEKMYVEFVKLNLAKNLPMVPSDKVSQELYDYVFDCGLDNYFDLIPKKYRTKNMYLRLLRINPTKYIGHMPKDYFDEDISADLVLVNSANMGYIPEQVKNEKFYLKLIKQDPYKYLKLLPEKYYTDEVIKQIALILYNRKDNRQIIDDLPINKLIIDKFPRLLPRFSDKIILKIIKEELCMIVATNQSVDIIIDKYGLNNKSIINILSKIKEQDIKAYKKINQKIEEHNKVEFTNVQDDIKRLETIIDSLGKLSRRKLTTEDKQAIAYYVKKYIYTPLEVIYTYNNSYMKKNSSETVNYFIEYVLEYSLMIDRYEGLTETRKITFDNPWLKDFDLDKHFNIVNRVPTSTYKYGADAQELTYEMAKDIIEILKKNQIPLNKLIVSIAFRRYFKGELEDYINELHEYDKIFKKPKRRKREV